MSEKIIVVLIIVAILLSVVSVIVTMSTARPVLLSEQPPKVIYTQGESVGPDSESARISLIINNPVTP
ncbi:MAG: hypothetical protein V1824_01730 [archaeon]